MNGDKIALFTKLAKVWDASNSATPADGRFLHII